MKALSAALSSEVALQLTTPLDTGRYALEDFQCREALSQPFEMDLVVTSDNLSVDFDKVMGKNITMTLLAKPQKRFFNGIVGHISQRDFTDQAHSCTYHVKAYPRFWMLKFSKEYKVFQNKSVQTIINDVLQEKGVTHVEDRTQRCGRTLRDYCVQYGESAFDFVSRLMEEEGIFYYFEHGNANHTMVLADQPSAHKDCQEIPQIEVDFARSEKPFLNVITSCFLDHQVVPGEHALTDYNYTIPQTSLFSKAKGAGKGGEIYDYPGLLDNDARPKKKESETFSSLRSELDDVAREILWGTSTCPFFGAGKGFTLQKHLRKQANQRYILWEVHHHISLLRDTPATQKDPLSPPKTLCANHFRAFPAKIPFRPDRKTPKPLIHGTQTALVTGPQGEEIHTDDQRRIKVQFHWDRLGKKDSSTSCWVRVSQSWAGNNWGLLFTPRVGMEVVVSFLNGDPDRPLVTGCVYNADKVPPYLAKDKTKATLKSNTHKGQGSNELRFEDEKQKEEIFLHAQKDWNTHVLENRTTFIEKGSDFKQVNKGDREVILKGEPGVISMKGEAPSLNQKGKEASKKGDDLLTLERGSRIVKIMGMGADKGSYHTSITKGNREVTILQGDNKDTYLKGNDNRTLAEGDKTLLIGKGNESATIGEGNKSLVMGKGDKLSVISAGNSTLLLPAGMFTGLMQGLFLKIGGMTLGIKGAGGDAHGGAKEDPRRDLHLESPSGDFQIKLTQSHMTYEQDGSKKVKISKDYEEKVGGKYVLEVDQDIIITCKGDIKIEAEGEISMKATKSFKVEAQSIEFKAQQDYTVHAMNMKCSLSMGLNLSGTMVDLKASAIANIKAAMLNLNV